jgi:hypothetical protein
MRWVLWGESPAAGDDSDPTASGTSRVPDDVLDHMITFIRRALAVPESNSQESRND